MRLRIRKKLKDLLALMLTMAMASVGTVSAFAAEAALIPVDLYMVTNTLTGETTDVEIFWSDDWFEEPSSEYNHELAITSIVLSGMTYLEPLTADHSDSDLRRAFVEFGFDGDTIEFYNYDHVFTEDDSNVAAFTLAAKQTEDGLLVAVVIRGTSDDELEWESDFRVSEDEEGDVPATEHYGFYQTESNVAEILNRYILDLADSDKDFTTDNIKFYVTGHSRGGSVADILASALNGIYGREKVYAYTFAAPAVAVSAGSNGYENIFNILNADDLLSMFSFYHLDFKRFGVDKVIASSGDYDSRNDDEFLAHDPFVYYARLKSGLPETLFM